MLTLFQQSPLSWWFPPATYFHFYGQSLRVQRENPAAHAASVKAIRGIFSTVVKLVPTTFHWIRGHAGVGGNERVDRVAKIFADFSIGIPAKPAPVVFDAVPFIVEWPYSILSTPLHLFLAKLPQPVPTLPTPVFASHPLVVASPIPDAQSFSGSSVPTHSMRLRERRVAQVVLPAESLILRHTEQSNFTVSAPARLSSISRFFSSLIVTSRVPVENNLSNAVSEQSMPSYSSVLDFMDRKHDS